MSVVFERKQINDTERKTEINIQAFDTRISWFAGCHNSKAISIMLPNPVSRSCADNSSGAYR